MKHFLSLQEESVKDMSCQAPNRKSKADLKLGAYQSNRTEDNEFLELLGMTKNTGIRQIRSAKSLSRTAMTRPQTAHKCNATRA